MGFIQDFKNFAFKGNLIDMAVGIVIGTAAGAIVKSFIDNIVSPLIAMLFNVPDLTGLTMQMGESADGEPILLKYGAFMQNLLDFVILAFAVFVAIKVAARFMEKAEEEPEPPAEVKLLTEIRDALKK
ncbi:MAG: large conductance mechanosensitive channel protein MscL [Pirellulaceae bacterium]